MSDASTNRRSGAMIRAAVLLVVAAVLLPVSWPLPALARPGDEPWLRGDLAPVHDPSIAREGGTWYVFSTGTVEPGSGIPIRRSRDLRHWERAGYVFADGLPSWVARVIPEAEPAPWAPDISWFGGRWHLYYAISTPGSWHSAIGVATNTTLDPDAPGYRWVDHGPVVVSQDFNTGWNAIDPNVVLDSDGVPWLTWGSFYRGIVLQQLDRRTGKPAAGAPVVELARRDPWFKGIEAPFIVRRGGYWYLFTSFGYCCRPDSNYSVRVGRSRHLEGPYVDNRGTPLLAGGGTLVLGGYGSVRGPGHQAVLREGDKWWLVHHFYDATRSGTPTLGIRPLLWARDGWPVAADPGFASAGDSLPDQRLVGAWHLSGYDTDPDGASDLLGVVPDLQPLDVVLRRGGTVIGGRGPATCPRPRPWVRIADGGARPGTWRVADGVLTLRLVDRCTGTISRFTLFVDRHGRTAFGRDDQGRAARAVRLRG